LLYEFRLLPALSLSFQRYPYPPAGVVDELPSSWGALPILVLEPGHLVLPSPDGEAFWIGLVAEARDVSSVVRIVASLASDDVLDVETGMAVEHPSKSGGRDIIVPPRNAVAGISRDAQSWWAFARATGGASAPASRHLEVLSSTTSARVELASPGRFEVLGGDRLSDLDPANRYGGWRLP
jgi:hypothetical protein